MRPIILMPLVLFVAGCGATTPAPAPVLAPNPVLRPMGLERVMGQPARSLSAMFGAPDLDIKEGPGRRLQFRGPICILDAYLYPQGTQEPIVTYVDARQPNGTDIDRASCVSALAARRQSR